MDPITILNNLLLWEVQKFMVIKEKLIFKTAADMNVTNVMFVFKVS